MLSILKSYVNQSREEATGLAVRSVSDEPDEEGDVEDELTADVDGM